MRWVAVRRLSRWLWLLFFVVLAAAGLQALLVVEERDPWDLPWTPLDLEAPIGLFTGAKLVRLGEPPGACRAALGRAGIGFTALPPRERGPSCGYDDAVRLGGRAPRAAMACPLAAGVAVWLREVVQPAAVEMLGSRVVAIEDYGSYACRRIYGRAEGVMSQHARANAVDIAGFRLADGRRITIARDWTSARGGAFLHRVRDGGCRLFGTTLSPDYNAAHRDHLHLDMAPRGGFGWRMCG